MLEGATDLDLPGDLDQKLPQVELGMPSIKTGEAGNERRRNDQDDLSIAERVAEEESGAIRDWRRHEVEIATQRRQGGGHEDMLAGRYQTRQALSRTIDAPGRQVKAFWNSGMFETTPLTR